MKEKKSISRRKFIKGMGGGLAGTAVITTGALARDKKIQEETATDAEKVKVKLSIITSVGRGLVAVTTPSVLSLWVVVKTSSVGIFPTKSIPL